MTSTRPAFVLGAGLMTCLGEGLQTHARALAAGQRGPVRIAEGKRMPSRPCHLVPDALVDASTGPDRLHALLQRVVAPALADAGLTPDQIRRMAVLVGSSCLDLPLLEDEYVRQAADNRDWMPANVPRFGVIAAGIARRFDIAGPQYTFNSACSSSSNALLYARRLLDAGHVEHALVIGVEGWNRVSVMGFGSMMMLSDHDCRPFDRERDGMVIGEGAGALVLSRAPRAGSAATALIGAASAGDPSAPTSSLPERIVEVMTEALDEAGLTPAELIAIKVHGTGTVGNDLAEARAMRILADTLPPFTSLKPYVGHTLGACGVIESLLLLAAWETGFLPATPGFTCSDPAIGLAPVTAAHALPARGAVLCNCLGFGGNNTSLVWSRT